MRRLHVNFRKQPHILGIDGDLPHLGRRFLCQRLGLTGGLKQNERSMDIGERCLTPPAGTQSGSGKGGGWDRAARNKLRENNRADTGDFEALLEGVLT